MSARTRVSVAPKVMRWARVSRGATVAEAAHRIDQDPAVIDAWENGRGDPTIGALEQLAVLYDRPLAVFLLDEPLDDPDEPVDFRASAGAGSRPLTRQTLLTLRRARRIQSIVSELRGDRTWQEPAVGGVDLDQAAGRLRTRLGIELDLQASWINPGMAFGQWRAALESIGVVVLQADLPLDEVRGLSVAGSPPVIVVNEHDWVASRVFTLFHEYGHLALGGDGICAPLQVGAQSSLMAETAANMFAGSFLVPGDALEHDPAIESLRGMVGSIDGAALSRVAGRFNVSRQVITPGSGFTSSTRAAW